MYCKYCGTQLDENNLCPKCGIVYEKAQPTNTEKIPRTSGMAVAGFVMAILQLFFDGPISIVLYWLSLVFSFVGMAHTKNGSMRGRGFAVTGLIIDLTAIFLGFLYGFVKAVR